MVAGQLSLLGREPPGFDSSFSAARRLRLGGEAWVDRVPGWVRGHQSFFEALERAMRWHATERPMYERVVAVPRLLASAPEDGSHPLLEPMAEALSARYGVRFDAVTLALYRDGADSVAWHRDREVREHREAYVAVVTLGGPRRFMLRPFAGGPAAETGAARRSVAFSIAWGDLVVMGGSCQRDFEHCVPKVKRAPPRMAIMFRHEVRARSEAPAPTR